MVTWSQTVRDLLPEPLLVCTCYSGQPRPALPQERDFTMKTPAVSAGCLQYKHSQGSQREAGWLWEQSRATRTGEHATVAGWGGQFGSGRVKRTPSAAFLWSSTRNTADRHSVGADCKLQTAQITSMRWSAAASSASFKQELFAALALSLSITSSD